MSDKLIDFPIQDDISSYPTLQCPCKSEAWEVLISTEGAIREQTIVLGARCISCKKILKFSQKPS